MQADGLSRQSKSPSLVPRRVDSTVLVRGGSCICLSPEAQKKVQVDGRPWGLRWQLAQMWSATCWLSAERTSLMGGARAVPLRSGPCNTAGGELMRPKAETRSVLRRAVSSARSPKVSSVWYVPGDQQEESLPSHCCCGRRWRRNGAPSIEQPP